MDKRVDAKIPRKKIENPKNQKPKKELYAPQTKILGRGSEVQFFNLSPARVRVFLWHDLRADPAGRGSS
jgi:hypothetical protein